MHGKGERVKTLKGDKYRLQDGMVDLRAAEIAEYGWADMANSDLAPAEYERLKSIFPDLRYVDGVGQYALHQIFYLPSYQSTIIAETQRHIARANRRIKSWYNALGQIVSQLDLDAYLENRTNDPQDNTRDDPPPEP
jgi:hypothetical protein